MGEDSSKISLEMISAGVVAYDEFRDSHAPYGLVERIYTAMRALENSGNFSLSGPRTGGHGLDTSA
jgi:hypothetical protein